MAMAADDDDDDGDEFATKFSAASQYPIWRYLYLQFRTPSLDLSTPTIAKYDVMMMLCVVQELVTVMSG